MPNYFTIKLKNLQQYGLQHTTQVLCEFTQSKTCKAQARKRFINILREHGLSIDIEAVKTLIGMQKSYQIYSMTLKHNVLITVASRLLLTDLDNSSINNKRLTSAK